ncbi:hypothetical protein [Bifidobacterium sp. AGR2158]|uniref:hypothetical protein n=1 Tax=Bifidobacterium sp. AGR2158 TaxID=1280675 RepID=UPI00041626B4|nr:hypothetical protein [Bifidobacterium sp. AGR2158]
MNTANLAFKALDDMDDPELTAEAFTLDGIIPMLSVQIGDLARRNTRGVLSPEKTDLLSLLRTITQACRERLHDISVEQQRRAVADPDEDGQAARGCDDGIDDADVAACGFPETTVWAYDAKQGRCRAFHVGGMIATAAACAKAHRDGYLTGLKDVRDLLDGMIADHDEDTDGDEACTHEGGA